ncbi:MAG TPA: Ig-like domain-containing protein [Opitutaceae bacterium]|nr:Ig-like domain-containing protein [Opitutaceae bacterium]
MFEATSPYAGGTVTFSAYANDLGSSSISRWDFVIPDGWTYVSTSAGGPDTTPAPGVAGTLEWTYTSVPTYPVSFSFTLNAPAGVTSTQTFTSTVFLKAGETESSLPSSTVMLIAPGVPYVTTGTPTPGYTTATVTASVDQARGSAVIARGIIYATTDAPTMDSGIAASSGSGTGGFTANLGNLAVGTTYYCRTFATNSSGTAYGNVISFTTAATLPAPTVTSASSTFDTTPTITGSAEAGTTITISVDGVNSGTTTVGANGTWSYHVPTALSTGQHSIEITDSDSAGHTSSASQTLTIHVPIATAPQPDGYGGSATGGSTATALTVSTVSDFVFQATATDTRVITVVGVLDVGTVSVASNKTIQGADSSASIQGCLRLSDVSNVIIRGLNFSNPSGSALQISNATDVIINHCTFLDCSGDQISILGNTDNATVSWCEFAATRAASQSSVRVGDGTTAVATHPLHVTFHHNWWARGLGGAVPGIHAGYVHQYSNHFDCIANIEGTDVRDGAQLLSERNVYSNMSSPLTKSGAATIRVNDNVYTGCTGSAPDAGSDTVFTPSYSYEMLATSDVASTIDALAGNTNGANTPTVETDTASISGPVADLAEGASATLTAVPSGFTGSSYQWRLNNIPIHGATGAAYTIASMSSATLGTYTVAIGVADGSSVVSRPLNVGLKGAPPLGSVIITGPSSPVASGTSAILTAKAGGFTSTDYTWFLNNNIISGATGASYTISSMGSSYVGTYAVAVRMPDGHLVRSPDFQVSLATSVDTGSDSGSSSNSSTGNQNTTGGSSSGTSGTSSSSGGGGGAIGFGFLASLALIASGRRRGQRTRSIAGKPTCRN